MKSGVEHLAQHPGWKTRKEVKPPLGLDDSQLEVLDRALTAAEEVLKDFKVGKNGLKAKSLTRFVATAFERHVTIHLATELANIAKHGHRNDNPEDEPKPDQRGLRLDASDTATILAALRLFQGEYEDKDAAQVAAAWPDHFDALDPENVLPAPLGTRDIDGLCERINCAHHLVKEPKPVEQQIVVFVEGGLVNSVIDLSRPKPEDGIEYEILDYDVLEGSAPAEVKEYFDNRSPELRAYMQKTLPDEYAKFVEAGR